MDRMIMIGLNADLNFGGEGACKGGDFGVGDQVGVDKLRIVEVRGADSGVDDGCACRGVGSYQFST